MLLCSMYLCAHHLTQPLCLLPQATQEGWPDDDVQDSQELQQAAEQASRRARPQQAQQRGEAAAGAAGSARPPKACLPLTVSPKVLPGRQPARQAQAGQLPQHLPNATAGAACTGKPAGAADLYPMPRMPAARAVGLMPPPALQQQAGPAAPSQDSASEPDSSQEKAAPAAAAAAAPAAARATGRASRLSLSQRKYSSGAGMSQPLARPALMQRQQQAGPPGQGVSAPSREGSAAAQRAQPAASQAEAEVVPATQLTVSLGPAETAASAQAGNQQQVQGSRPQQHSSAAGNPAQHYDAAGADDSPADSSDEELDAFIARRKQQQGQQELPAGGHLQRAAGPAAAAAGGMGNQGPASEGGAGYGTQAWPAHSISSPVHRVHPPHGADTHPAADQQASVQAAPAKPAATTGTAARQMSASEAMASAGLGPARGRKPSGSQARAVAPAAGTQSIRGFFQRAAGAAKQQPAQPGHGVKQPEVVEIDGGSSDEEHADNCRGGVPGAAARVAVGSRCGRLRLSGGAARAAAPAVADEDAALLEILDDE
jgi:hypothetical protein